MSKRTYVSNMLHNMTGKVTQSTARRRGLQGLATLFVLAVPVGVLASQNPAPEVGNAQEGKATTNFTAGDSTASSPADISVDVNHDSTSVTSRGSSHSVQLKTSSDVNTPDSLNVNGEDVPLPQGTSVHRSINGDGSSAQVDISVNNSSSTSSSSSVDVNITSDSSQETNSN